jgi:hypothetical protein
MSTGFGGSSTPPKAATRRSQRLTKDRAARLDACWISSRVEYPSAGVARTGGAADESAMSRFRFIVAAVLALTSLAVPSLAMALPSVPWGGTGANDLGPATILLSVAHGRVTVRNVQLVLACTNADDGTNFDQSWYAASDRPATLRLNRFTTTLSADAGGFEGTARLSGRLGSNGRGTSRIDVNAVARNDRGGIIARCSGRIDFRLRRP